MPRARRMVRRRRIARAAVGTAVVAGTAGVVHHGLDKHYANKEAEQQQDMYIQEQMEQEQYAPATEQAAPEVDLTSKLQQLADLHASGVLSDEEFAAAKQKLLAG
jgi:hypothetical protein